MAHATPRTYSVNMPKGIGIYMQCIDNACSDSPPLLSGRHLPNSARAVHPGDETAQLDLFAHGAWLPHPYRRWWSTPALYSA